jgi:hypothetical protein
MSSDRKAVRPVDLAAQSRTYRNFFIAALDMRKTMSYEVRVARRL